MIACVHGPDAALCRAAVADLTARYDSSGQSTSRLDGKTASLGEIVAQAASPGFFGQGRVVIVDDLIAKSTRAGKFGDEGGRDSSAAALDLTALANSVSDENLLILAEPSLPAIPAAVRRTAPPDIRIIAGEPPRGAALIAWIQRQAESAQSTVDQATARFLAERIYPLTWANKPNNPRFDIPPDLDRLANEIDKLAVAADPEPISRPLVERLVASGERDQVFRFADAAGRGALGDAVVELRKLVESGQEPFAITAQLYQQAELAIALTTAGPGREPTAIGRDLGLTNPGRLAAIANAHRGRRSDDAAQRLADTLDVDRQVKRGELRDPLDPLYSLLARSASGAVPGTRRSGR